MSCEASVEFYDVFRRTLRHLVDLFDSVFEILCFSVIPQEKLHGLGSGSEPAQMVISFFRLAVEKFQHLSGLKVRPYGLGSCLLDSLVIKLFFENRLEAETSDGVGVVKCVIPHNVLQPAGPDAGVT